VPVLAKVVVVLGLDAEMQPVVVQSCAGRIGCRLELDVEHRAGNGASHAGLLERHVNAVIVHVPACDRTSCCGADDVDVSAGEGLLLEIQIHVRLGVYEGCRLIAGARPILKKPIFRRAHTSCSTVSESQYAAASRSLPARLIGKRLGGGGAARSSNRARFGISGLLKTDASMLSRRSVRVLVVPP